MELFDKTPPKKILKDGSIGFSLFLPILAGCAASIFFEFLSKNKLNENTKNIIILGSKGSGKTTLWRQLQNKILDLSTTPTDETPIESFHIFANGRFVKVPPTKDIGGGNDWVNSYESIINKDGTYIYYLVDLTNLHHKNMALEIRARLIKISSIIKDKKLKDCGCKILLTNKATYDKRLKKKFGLPLTHAKNLLKLNTKGLSFKIDDIMMPIELTNSSDIDKIKKEITSN